MTRLLIVSNRLPISIRVDHGALCLTRSSGGLAAAMRGPHERMCAVWIGWPGSVAGLTPEQRQDADAALAGIRAVPVHLGATEQHRFYDGFSNGVLWPLFHYLLDKVNLDAELDWEAYQRVNERFADIVADQYKPGDVIWVHDYQLMLLPALLRRRLPGARIGFFLHVPFPSADVFRILPWREQIVRGLLGADLLGFHTAGFRRNFAASAAHVLGLDPDEAAIEHDGRRVALGVHPISIDAAEIARLAAHPGVREEAARIRAEAGGRKIVLGIDRLDYTKGIPRRLLAIERFLEREPELRDQVRFIQLAVPTREMAGAYAEFRRVVHEMVGRINGQHGTTYATPIHYMHRSVPFEQVVALYLAADVMLVTPLRDGMNLVAKEYVAARIDHDGALILSEFAGAASELAEAISVNPYDIGSVAAAVKRALTLPLAEQQTRMAALRRRVDAHDVHRWSQSFLDDLDRAAAPALEAAALSAQAARREVPESVVERVRQAPQRVWILDYDGTLVPFAPVPDLAAPDEELLALLRALSERDRVHVVSGRPRADIERWFGALPLHLHAEHGFWSRPRSCDDWVPLESDAAAWKGDVRALLEDFTRRTPGSFIEEKTVTLAWHYRTADPELAGEHVRALRARLAERVSADRLELLGGAKVVEIRPRGVHKGRVVPLILDDVSARAEVIAIGDDRTDEDIFAALPPTACTIHVGGNDQSRAVYRLPDARAVRRLLRSIHA
ncbi:bifunctional alpha,alpha-trehalose-phosphate synthase (UDP-forming)/trehalose-phosphatase [Sorangium cellulosum]|uniref:Glucosylglycerol-phosphate synthase n=1 Tax=Sorangium cellulosum So0157-2 TaxID=1254432 RepID=S4XKV6_SORCE|nr:bifunctional alpha,alpha-trehalose-phosphate synthase (UDP-forming)/trehalose-phosphatase [Sorangium cellulosum]AGP32405.1 glycosyl transferase family 1 [Sorangium cellulosum So0157-2]